jgi:gluconolactonase
VWWKEGGYLLFSDINGNRRMKYTPGQGTVEFKKPTNGANGLTRDLQGRLVACEGAGRRVIRRGRDRAEQMGSSRKSDARAQTQGRSR